MEVKSPEEETDNFKDIQEYQDIKAVKDKMDDVRKNIEKFENVIGDAQREASLIKTAHQFASEQIQNLAERVAGLEHITEDISTKVTAEHTSTI